MKNNLERRGYDTVLLLQTPLKRGVAGRNPATVFGPRALHLRNESGNEFEETFGNDKFIQAMKFAGPLCGELS